MGMSSAHVVVCISVSFISVWSFGFEIAGFPDGVRGNEEIVKIMWCLAAGDLDML